MAMAALPRCSCLTTYNSYCFLGPGTDAVHGAAGHNLGSDGRRPQNRTARTADAPQRKCSQSARLEERAAT